ncbi:unnamed protein product [Darwinula stevensoni]|uniref:Uncharacterized protein n=1 Tax=Darwinula stevensoni TaxID=69355 RepID=A0A7R8ZZI4_9CRUS|nr:unnamed protein product [Darwinula stevensoni]CAG0878916.1 unnamed protein product [Darwinula stevensoni]
MWYRGVNRYKLRRESARQVVLALLSGWSKAQQRDFLDVPRSFPRPLEARRSFENDQFITPQLLRQNRPDQNARPLFSFEQQSFDPLAFQPLPNLGLGPGPESRPIRIRPPEQSKALPDRFTLDDALSFRQRPALRPDLPPSPERFDRPPVADTRNGAPTFRPPIIDTRTPAPIFRPQAFDTRPAVPAPRPTIVDTRTSAPLVRPVIANPAVFENTNVIPTQETGRRRPRPRPRPQPRPVEDTETQFQEPTPSGQDRRTDPLKQAIRSRPRNPPNRDRLEDEETESKNNVRILKSFMDKNPDGTFTFGYENEDGSYKEETRGKDCIVRGKYGYVDPTGVKREFTYVQGLPCDHNKKKEKGQSSDLDEDQFTADGVVASPAVGSPRRNSPRRP